ncbi:hypothetical protein Lser_V15G19622 [Lactuca serriola]
MSMCVRPSDCWKVASGFLERFEPEDCEVPSVCSFHFGASFNFSHGFIYEKALHVGVVCSNYSMAALKTSKSFEPLLPATHASANFSYSSFDHGTLSWAVVGRVGSLARGCNSSFITLAPKIKDPLSLNDYRRISLMGCVSKIISKILSNRMKSVIGKVIGDEQSAYVEGRCILEGPLMINEVCSWAKRVRKKILLFKVDFDKALDSVNWQYLDSVLEQMGFGNKWRMWIRGSLSSSRASVIINGSPTKEFPISRGVRQGDPLSSYLFIIAMEGLSVALKTACNKGMFSGVQIPRNSLNISHLLYTDDALFIGEWSRTNLKNLARILRCFHISSGPKFNFHKSKVFGIRTSMTETVNWANLLGCAAGALPFVYLGVPVGANMNLIKNWKPVINKFHSKLSLWKAKTLSFDGRLTLIKSVLGNLPTYYLSLFKAPTGVLEELEKIRKSFLWGGCDEKKKIHWVSWDKVLTAKCNGGLGLGSIKALNIGLLVKWWWRLKDDRHSLWARVIYGIHNLADKPFEYLSRNTSCGVWNNIGRIKKTLLEQGIDVQDIFRLVIKSGNEFMFWYDSWLGSGSLKVKYPSLFELESRKQCIVADRISGSNYGWNWKSSPGLGLDPIVSTLSSDVSGIHLRTGLDYWSCRLNADGRYSVCSLKKIVDSMYGNVPDTLDMVWSNVIPIKVSCFIWRAVQDRIPTALALEKRGIMVN